MPLTRAAVLLLAALSLSGCATHRAPTAPAAIRAHAQQVKDDQRRALAAGSVDRAVQELEDRGVSHEAAQARIEAAVDLLEVGAGLGEQRAAARARSAGPPITAASSGTTPSAASTETAPTPSPSPSPAPPKK